MSKLRKGSEMAGFGTYPHGNWDQGWTCAAHCCVVFFLQETAGRYRYRHALIFDHVDRVDHGVVINCCCICDVIPTIDSSWEANPICILQGLNGP